MSKIAIMQPYVFPYIGYFQLIAAVDEFVVYDNIQYTKKGWINRNRILVNGTEAYITLPLKKGSDFLDIKDRYLSDDWVNERKKLLNRITESYRKAPYFTSVFPLIESIVKFEENNLFYFILNSIAQLKDHLNIKTPIITSSTIEINNELKGEQKVMALCKKRNCKNYINPIGGVELYSKEVFEREGISLQFLRSNNILYTQFENEFVPFLSIIDVLMFNSKEEVQNHLRSSYELV